MLFRTLVAMAAFGVAVACTKPAEPVAPAPAPAPSPDQAAAPAAPAGPDPFARSLAYDCGGTKLDVIAGMGASAAAKIRVDGAAVSELRADTLAQNGLVYTDGAGTSLTMGGGDTKWTTPAGAKTCMFIAKELPAPTPEGVTKILTAADKGAKVELKVGEKFAISLVGVPTAGYLWAPEAPPAFLKTSDGGGGPTSTAQMQPGFAGGNHWEVVIVEATAAGEADLTLVQKRPWEDKADAQAERFKVHVKAS